MRTRALSMIGLLGVCLVCAGVQGGVIRLSSPDYDPVDSRFEVAVGGTITLTWTVVGVESNPHYQWTPNALRMQAALAGLSAPGIVDITSATLGGAAATGWTTQSTGPLDVTALSGSASPVFNDVVDGTALFTVEITAHAAGSALLSAGTQVSGVVIPSVTGDVFPFSSFVLEDVEIFAFAVPEPASIAGLSVALLGCAGIAWRRRRRKTAA